MRLILFTTLTMLSSAAFATDEETTLTETQIADSFNRFSNLNVVKTNPGCKAAAAGRSPASEGGGKEKPMNAACDQYISKDGKSVGQKGKQLQELFKGKAAEALLGDDAGNKKGMDKACPGYGAFDEEQRKNFWTWAFATIANQESSCGTDSSSMKGMAGSNGTVIGEFQLNKELSGRNWRGKSWGGKACAAKDVTNFKENAACAVDIMTDQFMGVYDKKNPGLTGNSYWQEIKTNTSPSRETNSPILKNMKKFPGC